MANGLQYEWDEAKCEANIAKHGVDFADVEAFEWDTAVEAQDDRHDEARWIAIGFVGPRLHVVAYTARGDVIRVISLRKANQREERRYDQERESR